MPSCAVTGISLISGLGMTPTEHLRAMDAGRTGLRPLGELMGNLPALADLPASWITPRDFLAGNRYGPATNLALALAERAIADAGWTAKELRDCWLLVGTSRGNSAGTLDPWPGRRGHQRMDTSNSMHSEMAAAVSIAFGIRGPYQVISNACASGLDAIGLGYWFVSSEMAPRMLVIGTDLPLLPRLLRSYAQTGLLSRNGLNDPYSPHTTGFLPGEGGAALALEADPAGKRYAHLHGYWANSDAYHPLGLPPEGEGIAECLTTALQQLAPAKVTAICPHASGTHAHGQAERRALQRVFGNAEQPISLHLLKPFTGHTIGASGTIDTAILCQYLRQNLLPPNLPGLTGAGESFTLPATAVPADDGLVLKISVGMGGHNAIIALSRNGG